ncbi:MAG: winged helix DNA-binding protein [Lachnospiraceae bacterium]|nr:winged helix DNA-binding protein [Lachnospiraceae bacterium]
MNDLKEGKMRRFNYLSGEIDAVYHETALQFGLSDSAMLVLYAACSNGGSCPIDDICRLSGVRKQTINSALRKLEKEGVVYLEAIDKKRKRVCLTEKGMEMTGRTVARLITIENEIMDAWTQEEYETYLSLTDRYLTALKEKTKEAAGPDEDSIS